jgi:hypothetical protein
MVWFGCHAPIQQGRAGRKGSFFHAHQSASMKGEGGEGLRAILFLVYMNGFEHIRYFNG